METKSRWMIVASTVLMIALISHSMDEGDFNNEPETDEPERDAKVPNFSYKTTVTTTTSPVTNATRRPVHCFFCTYDSKLPRVRTCLDPIRFTRMESDSIFINSSTELPSTNPSNETTTTGSLNLSVYRMISRVCRSLDDQCFTSIHFNTSHELVHRGCTSNCATSLGMECCKTDRCNNQPVLAPERLLKLKVRSSGTIKSTQASLFFIVTMMLILQTVVRATFVLVSIISS